MESRADPSFGLTRAGEEPDNKLELRVDIKKRSEQALACERWNQILKESKRENIRYVVDFVLKL